MKQIDKLKILDQITELDAELMLAEDEKLKQKINRKIKQLEKKLKED